MAAPDWGRHSNSKGQMTANLSKPIVAGFMRACTLTPDAPVGAATTNVDAGDSTIVIDPSSTSTLINFWVRGDGSVGTGKTVTITVAQEVPTDPPVSIDVVWDVIHADATVLTFAEGTTGDVPIPAGKKK